MKIKKAIITASGLGTRMLPASKAFQKELTPVLNIPCIQYNVDLCIDAGIKEIIIVKNFNDSSIENYFKEDPNLINYLEKGGKQELAQQMKELNKSVKIIFQDQDETLPYGNARPLYSAKNLIGEDPFIMLWGDDLFLGKTNPVKELIEIYENQDADIVLNCTIKDDPKEIKKLAMVVVEQNTNIVKKIIEKPKDSEIVSNIGSVSPYLFTSKIFDQLNPNETAENSEFLIQKAITKIIETGGIVRTNIGKALWMAVGDPFNYARATVEMALADQEISNDFKKYLEERLSKINN